MFSCRKGLQPPCLLPAALLAVLLLLGSAEGQSESPALSLASVPAWDDPSVALISTGLELADALANPNKTWAILTKDVVVTDSDFSAYAQPIPRISNFTITGNQTLNQASYPVLGLGFVKAKVRQSVFYSLLAQSTV